jgi:hypothetical protein
MIGRLVVERDLPLPNNCTRNVEFKEWPTGCM